MIQKDDIDETIKDTAMYDRLAKKIKELDNEYDEKLKRERDKIYKSKLAEYAGQAMQGYCANTQSVIGHETRAKASVLQAKALLAELAKEGEG